MTREDYLFLRDLDQNACAGYAALPRDQRDHFHRLERMGYLRSSTGGGFDLLPDGRIAMQEYLRTASEKEAESQRARQTAASIDAISIALEQTRDEFADYKAQQAKQRDSDAVQAAVDKKKQLRHEYLVAAFTVALTLFLEHFLDIVELAKLAFESLVALLK